MPPSCLFAERKEGTAIFHLSLCSPPPCLVHVLVLLLLLLLSSSSLRQQTPKRTHKDTHIACQQRMHLKHGEPLAGFVELVLVAIELLCCLRVSIPTIGPRYPKAPFASFLPSISLSLSLSLSLQPPSFVFMHA